MRQTSTLLALLITTAVTAQGGTFVPLLPGNAAGPRGDCDPPAVQSQPPADVEMCQGDSVLLEIAATGTDLIYNWFQNGSFVPDDMGPSFEVSPFPGLSTTIECLVHGQCGQVNVDVVVHAVPIPQPAIGLDGNMLVCYGPASSFQWYLDGVEIPGATSDTYTPTENGSYVVKAGNGSCIGVSDPYYFGSVGIGEVERGSITVQHAPGSDDVLITGVTTGAIVEIFDLTGKELQRSVATGTSKHITMEGLPDGIYLVRAGRWVQRILR